MALIGKDGIKVTYEGTELIKELKRDIEECGKDKVFAVFIKKYPKYNVEVITNYDFMSGNGIALFVIHIMTEILTQLSIS